SGGGISAQVQDRLLRDLFASTKGKRRGMGLAVAYGILHSYRGGFRLDSVPGKGTTARIFLPAGSAPVSPQSARPAPAVPAARQSRILVVDDDPLILKSLGRTLEGAGYRVRTAPGPLEAITQFAQADE